MLRTTHYYRNPASISFFQMKAPNVCMHAIVLIHIVYPRLLCPSLSIPLPVSTNVCSYACMQRKCNQRSSQRQICLNRHALVQLVNGIPSSYIDILREQLVRHLVFFQYVVVCARARKRGAEEEAEDPVAARQSVSYCFLEVTKRNDGGKGMG